MILQDATIGVVMAGWVAFSLALVLRVRQRGRSRRRDVRSWGGMGLQGAGAALVFSESHSWVRVDWVALLRAAGAMLLAVSGALLMIAAVRTLGKQWSLTARVLEDHELVTSGPYGIVRHPIYTGLVALVLATGLAQSDLLQAAAGTLLCFAGSRLRVRREEGLLREAFGERYDAYAARVPALVPRLGLGPAAPGALR